MLLSDAADILTFFGSPILQSFYKVCLAIDFVIYNLISWLYTIFITIAKARLFTSETIQPFIDRIYLIIGIAALFFAAYTFLTIIANPENMTKGNSSPAKAIRNIILGIIAITFIPTIFNFAYSVQGSVVDQNIIAKIFMTREETLMDDSEQNLGQFGITMFEASYYVKNDDGSDTFKNVQKAYSDAETNAMKYNDVSYFSTTVEGVASGYIQYNYILAGIIGIVIVYVFFTYCFDLGLRAIKLTFLQIISPVPCLLLMVPGQDKMFKTWLKDTLKTFFEVFLKIFIVVFCVYMIMLLRQWFDTSSDLIFSSVSPVVVNFAKIFIFLGVIMFMKKAPKLIENAIGIKMDPKGLSLKQRLQDSGIATAFDKTVGIAGSMAASYVSNKKGAAKRLETNEEYLKANAQKKKQMLRKETGVGGALAMGAFLGARGGRAAIGTAYNTGFDTQRDKANHLSRREMALNYARGYLGMESRYEELNELDKIKTDAEDYRDRRQYQRDEAAVTGIKSDIDNAYDPSLKATEKLESSYKATMDHVDDETRKGKSGITRKVAQARYVKYDDQNSNLRVQTGVNRGKNASQLINEEKTLDATISAKEAEIQQFEQQKANLEKQRVEFASAGKFGAAKQFEDDISAIDAQIVAAQTQITNARTNKAQISSDLGTLSSQGGSIEFSLVSGLNRANIEENRDKLIMELQKQGASAQQAAEAFSLVNTGEYVDEYGTRTTLADKLGIAGLAAEDKARSSITVDDVFSYKSAVGSIVRQYFDDNAESDSKLKEHIAITTAASQNTQAGVDVSTFDASGKRVDDGSVKVFNVGQYTSIDGTSSEADVNSFVEFFDDHVKGSTSKIQSNKKIEFNTSTIPAGMDYEVTADGREIVRATPRSVNAVLDEMEVIKPRRDDRLKAHEAFAKQHIGLQEAAQSAKKRMEIFKAKRGNGDKH